MLDLMDKTGFHAISISQLAKTAGVARQTFYRHYKSREDVLLRGMEELFDQVVEAVKADGGDAALTAPRYAFAFWGENRRLFKAIMRAGVLQQALNRYDTYVSEHALPNPAADRNVTLKYHRRFARKIVVGGVFLILMDWIQNDLPLRPDQVSDICINLLASVREYGRADAGP